MEVVLFDRAETVSVVIAAWNGERFIKDALDSIFRQTVPVHEVIVVIDGTKDKTAEIASSYVSVRVIEQENAGRGAARNAGIFMATGDAIVILDQDDVLLENNFEVGLRMLNEHPEAAFSGGFSVSIDEAGQRAGGEVLGPHQPCSFGSMLRGSMFVPPSSVMFRRQVLQKVGGFDTAFIRGGEDSDLYLKIAQIWPVHSHKEIVVGYRRHDSNGSNDAEAMLSTSLQFMDKQYAFVKKNPQFLADWKAGRRYWCRLFGQFLVMQAASVLKSGDTGKVLKLLYMALRYCPYSYVHYLKSSFSRVFT